MKYPEFLSSAKRHNHTCRVLKDKIDSYQDNEISNDEYKFLVLSLYYLSGYIIECSLKFKIFELMQFNVDSEVDEVECNKVGIDYKKRIKTHNFKKLQNFLDSLVSDMNHESEKSTINKLLNSWSPEIRYTVLDVNYAEIKELYTHTNNFLKKM
ncbi:hypothetical protein [Siccibacter turicensis]|uniref:hypothetical protein n=1 Tax=Siccibacter turicensis TaxID=357233 RepID=UPI000464235D|nr:hypothetical protein [Siccibacter turicensis]